MSRFLYSNFLNSGKGSSFFIPVVSSSNLFAILSDIKTTSSGTFTSGAWRTRDLNTEYDPHNIVSSLSSNQFTLNAGTYYIYAVCPAYRVYVHKARLYNITDSTVVSLGTNEYTNYNNTALKPTSNQSLIECKFTITSTKTFEIQHRCSQTLADIGFGINGFLSNDVYTQVFIAKLQSQNDLFKNIAILKDEKANNTQGGTSSTTTWQTRDLNTEYDSDGIVSLSANQFTLNAGTYYIEASAFGYFSGEMKTRIRDITNNTTLIAGQCPRSEQTVTSSCSDGVRSFLYHVFTISTTTTYELQQYSRYGFTNNGLGIQCAFGDNEIYSVVKIAKINPLSTIALVEDTKSSGTSGGTFTLGAWRTRDLNTETDPNNIVSISSNQFTLNAGSYLISWRAPAYRVGTHSSKLYNVTDAVDELIGTGEYSSDATNTPRPDSCNSFGIGFLTVDATSSYEIRHYSSASRSTDGFGLSIGTGETEHFTQVLIIKI